MRATRPSEHNWRMWTTPGRKSTVVIRSVNLSWRITDTRAHGGSVQRAWVMTLHGIGAAQRHLVHVLSGLRFPKTLSYTQRSHRLNWLTIRRPLQPHRQVQT